MGVVGPLELVLDEDVVAVDEVPTEDVGAEGPDLFSWDSTSSSMPTASPSNSMFSGRASQGVSRWPRPSRLRAGRPSSGGRAGGLGCVIA